MPTMKQINRNRFFVLLEKYENALASGENVVGASLAIHAALGLDGVPKYYKRFVTRAFREVGKTKQEN